MQMITDELLAYLREDPAHLIEHVKALKLLVDTGADTNLRVVYELFIAALIDHHRDELMRRHPERYRWTSLTELHAVHERLLAEGG
jgi:hypothetical protein